MEFYEAMGTVERYVDGDITSGNSDFKVAINVLSGYSSVMKFNYIINGKDADRYDIYIRAFATYWRLSGEDLSINTDYFKCMMAPESVMGTIDGTRHGLKDVMQCLDALNPPIYVMARRKPVNGVPYDPNEGLAYMNSKGYGCLQNIFENGIPNWKKTGPIMSICFGVLWFAYKSKRASSLKQSVIDYNGLGDDEYWDKVSTCYKNPTYYFNHYKELFG